MNKSEYLITKLMEECAEVAQRCSKILCFGIHEKEPGQELNNEERLLNEYHDLLGVFESLEDEKIVRTTTGDELMDAIADKKQKVKKFMAYSVNCGTLQI